MRSFLLGMAAGVCCLQMQADLPGQSLMLLLLAGMLAFILAARLFPIAAVKMSSLLCCGMVAGFLWAAFFAQRYLSDALPAALEGQDITIIGTIHSLPFRFPEGSRFNFAVESAQLDGKTIAAIPPKIALSWYARSSDEPAVPTLQPGERWQLKVHLQRPHGNANPGSFDYEAWLLEQDLRATGTVRVDTSAPGINHRIDAFVWSFNNLVEYSRGWLRDRIINTLAGKQYAGVIVALVVGDERGVGQSDWKVFNRSGIGHLIAISGLHIL